MCLRMAFNDDPSLSLSAMTASTTITEYVGIFAFLLSFLGSGGGGGISSSKAGIDVTFYHQSIHAAKANRKSFCKALRKG